MIKDFYYEILFVCCGLATILVAVSIINSFIQMERYLQIIILLFIISFMLGIITNKIYDRITK